MRWRSGSLLKRLVESACNGKITGLLGKLLGYPSYSVLAGCYVESVYLLCSVATVSILFTGVLGWSQTTATSSLAELGDPKVIALDGRTFHVQGIDLDGDHLWVTSADTVNRKGFLHLFSWPGGKLIRSVEIQRGDRFHPGGISSDAQSLWIPVAEYRRNSTSVIQRRDKRSLNLLSEFEVSDHIGCIASRPDALIGGNWDSRQFYIWDHSGRLTNKIANPTQVGYQEMKFVSGTLVASGLLPGKTGAIDWLDFPSLLLIRRITTGSTDRGVPYTNEGMTVRNGTLYLLPEDGPSRLFAFPLRP